MCIAARVAFPIPKNQFYHYDIPARLRNIAVPGKRVYVPLGRRKSIGYLISIDEAPAGIELKEILDVIDDKPLFDEKRLKFFQWISNYYFCSLGLVLKTVYPMGLGINLSKKINITAQGTIYLDTKVKNNTEKQVLRILSASGDTTVDKLFELAEGLTNSILNRLIAGGYVNVDYEINRKSVVKTEHIYHPADKSKNKDIVKILGRKRPAKFRIVEYIFDNEPISYNELKEIFGNVSAHLKWLEDNGYILKGEREIIRDPFESIPFTKEQPHRLNPDQQIVLDEILTAIIRRKYSPFLLHGVTGSGKTEIYINSIEKVVNNGGNAIVLVPEISLTPQLVRRFRGRFGKNVVVLHSGLNEGERMDAWRLIYEGRVNIAIGARSTIFAPFKTVDIIIVDEEHETSYKQEESPHYNARDISLVLAKLYDSVVVLGSATPSVESYSNSIKDKFTYLNLPLRVLNQTLPSVEIIDMKNQENPILSEKLKDAILENYKRGNQTIIFLNRRGFSSVMICRACGESVMCPNCSITLTYHSTDESVRCHYCSLHEKKLTSCLKCGNPLSELGFGTQRLEHDIGKLIPQASVSRMDRDEIRGKNKLLNLYQKLERKEIDVLIGTQMVAKGHDLPGVTLVGIISADMSLYNPDFRAGERTFQLITQVAGRSGRGNRKGRVLVQTYNPDHPAILKAASQDSIIFLKGELKLREALEFPPYSKLINVRFTGTRENETKNVATMSRQIASKIIKNQPIGSVKILGPSPSPVARLKNKFRWQMLLKSQDQKMLHNFASMLLKIYNKSKMGKRVQITIDVDPYSFN